MEDLCMKKAMILMFVLTNLCFMGSGLAQSTSDEISQKMEGLLGTMKLPGAGMVMVHKDSVLYQKGFGYADISTKTPYTSTTLQNIGSTSKTLIGVALMKLVDQGKIGLDDAINKHLPFCVANPYFPNEPITIRHLATHTSGIRDTPSVYDLKSYYIDNAFQKEPISKKGLSFEEKIFLSKTMKNKPLSLASYLQSLLDEHGALYGKRTFYRNAPGAEYEYTNIGAALAGYIIEKVSGKSYAEFTTEEILTPLQMKASGWFYDDLEMDNFATRYTGKDHIAVPFYELTTYPDGGLKSSVADMALYLQEMIRGFYGEGSLLSKESYAVLFKNQLQVPSKERSGIFWDVFGSEGEGDIGHAGSDPGIETFMYFKPETKIGKILFVNTGHYKEDIIQVWQEFIAMEQLFLTE